MTLIETETANIDMKIKRPSLPKDQRNQTKPILRFLLILVIVIVMKKITTDVGKVVNIKLPFHTKW